MSRRISILGLGIVGAFFYHVVVADTVYYELFQKGDPTTDQSVGAPGSHSTLVSASGDDIRDDDFIQNVAKRALASGAKLYFSIGSCYSGGSVDDLASLGGNQSILTSARHSESASYGYPAPDGVDLDSTDTFTKALGDGTVPAAEVAAQAVALNPFGPNPNAPRITEKMGSEHAQYFALGDGARLKPKDFAATGMAVLWAGMPNERDRLQMNLMIEHFVQMGYDRDRIWLLYGSGKADSSHEIVRSQMIGVDSRIHLLAATREQLLGLFANTFAPNKKHPDFVFFYVGDHGGLGRLRQAKHNYGRPDRLITQHAPTALFGDGDDKF